MIMKTGILKADERGLMQNSVFNGHTIFSNGQSTKRPDNFGTVYVFNDDTLFPKSYLGMHPHANVEIVTIMLTGAESHKDTLGVHENYYEGDVQLISSGKGVHHAGGNISAENNARHLQIWISPRSLNTEPSVQVLKKEAYANEAMSLQQLVTPDGVNGSLKINQDVWVYQGNLQAGAEHTYVLNKSGNGVMVYVVDGSLETGIEVVKKDETIFITETEIINLKTQDSNTPFILIETVM
jgi:redox-sensitive bicupin YhaK (pirin superfamily)